MASAPLKSTAVTLSILNPQTNQYQQIGQLPLAGVRTNGKILLIVFRAQNQALMAIDTSQPVNWTVTNSVYATYIDPKNKVFLFLFRTKEDAEVFSLFALSNQSAQNPGSAIVLEKGSGQQIGQNDSISVDYKLFNFKEPNFDHPVEDRDVTVNSSYASPLKNLFSGGFYGATHIVFFENDVFAIATVKPTGGSQLPQLPETTQAAAEEKAAAVVEEVTPKQNTETIKEEPKKPEAVIPIKEEPKIITPKPDPIPEKAPTTTAPTQQQQQQQKEKENIKEKQVVEEKKIKPVFDAQLEQIRTEMTNKFNDLSKMVTSLKRQQTSRATSPQSSDILVASVQRLIKENEEKDRLISEKQQLIDMLNAKKSDTRERDELRKQLAELTSKVASQKEATQKKLDEQRKLKDKVEILKQKIVAARNDSESRLAAVRRELEAERQKQLSDLGQTKQQLQWNVAKAEDEVKELKKKISEAEAENKKLKERTKNDSAKELEKLKAAADGLLMNTVKRMVSGVFQIAQKNFNSSGEYDGAQVIKGVRQALQMQAEEILEELEPEEQN